MQDSTPVGGGGGGGEPTTKKGTVTTRGTVATTEALIKTVKEEGNKIITTWTDKNGRVVKTNIVTKGTTMNVPGGTVNTGGGTRKTQTKIIGNKRVTIVTVNGKVVERTEELIDDDSSSDEKRDSGEDTTKKSTGPKTPSKNPPKTNDGSNGDGSKSNSDSDSDGDDDTKSSYGSESCSSMTRSGPLRVLGAVVLFSIALFYTM